MKRLFLKKVLIVSAIILLSTLFSQTYATHIPGANITYTCNAANPLEYTFRLTVFRRCPGTHPNTMAGTYFTLTNDCGLTNPVVPTFNQVGVEQDVNQLCSSATSNCSGGTQPGVWMYTYEATITLPANCNGWHMEYSLCCRDQSTNLSGGTGNTMVTYTTLNTLTSPCNSSPVVTAQPIPYACTNTNFNYCLTTYDPQGDSISYSMVAPLNAGQVPIAHMAGFSAAAPLTGFSINAQTGCMTFNEPNVGNYVVAIMIREWDNAGNLLSEIIHDFQIQVISCTNTPPTNPVGGISNFSGSGNQTGPNTISACYGDNVCFDVVFQDLVDVTNNLTITTDGTTLLPGATFTQTGTNPVTGTFCWTSQPGYLNDVITFIAYDDGCPVMGTTGFAVDFDIETGVYAGPDLTICGTQSAQLIGQGATSYSWSPAIGLSCTNCTAPLAQPLVTTTYVVTGNLTGTCTNTDTVTVNVVPDFTITQTPASATICANEVVQLNASGTALYAPYTWSWDNGGSLNNDAIQNPLAQPLFSTNYTVTMTASTGCRKTSTVPVTVSGIGPTVTLNPSDTSICQGQTVPIVSTSKIIPVACGISAGCSGTTSVQTIGTATSSTTTYGPFYASATAGTDYTTKVQYIFTAAELNAMGYTGGTIRDFALYVTTADNSRFDGVTVWMGCTSQSEFTNTSFIGTASLTQVYGPVNNLNPTNGGWHTFNITDYDWDGMSNLVIQICSEDVGNQTSQSVQYSTTSPAYRCMRYASTTIAACTNPTGSRYTSRANVRFTMCEQGLSSPTYQWLPTANLSSTNTPNTVATPPSSTAYVLNVTDNGCTGSAIVQVNVSADYTLNATATSTNICYSQSTTLNAVTSPGSSGPWTYSWSPTTGLSDPSIQSPTATPDITTTYTVVASNGYCNKTSSITINVAGGPANAVVLPTDTVCPNTVVNLDVYTMPAACGIAPAGCPVGGSSVQGATGTSVSSTTSYGPFYGSTSTSLVYDYKRQYIYSAQELTDLGFRAGRITELSFYATTVGSHNYDDLTIHMGCTSLEEFPNTTFVPPATMSQVFYRSQYNANGAGWNVMALDNGFNWDGVSNIIIQICGVHGDQTGSMSTYYTCLSGTNIYKQLYYSSSSVPSCAQLTGNRTSCRGDVRFTMCYPSFAAGSSYTWSPGNGISNINSSNPTCTVTGDYTYTVSVVDPASPGCPYVGDVSVWVDRSNYVTAIPDTTLCSAGAASIQLDATYTGALPPIPKSCGTGQTCSGTTVNGTVGTPYSATSTYSPFYGSTSTLTNYTRRVQYIYTAAELLSAGLNTGVIRDLALEITTNYTYQYDNVRIYIGCTTQDEFTTTSFATTPMTLVWSGNNFNPITGWNVFNIADYGWDGTSNIIVQICSEEDNALNSGSESVRYSLTSPAYRCMYYSSTTATIACNSLTGSRTTGRANMQFNVCTDFVSDATYVWSPAGSLNNANISNPLATVSSTTRYIVTATAGTNCVVSDTVDVTINPAATAPIMAPMTGTYCPNTTMTLTAGGGIAGGSTMEWYTGPNGTGTWLGTGSSYTITPTTSGQTYYVRREGPCGVTTDDNVTINLKDYIYGLNSATTNTYCTDNAGWHHFYNGNEILLSVRGDLTGAPAGFPQITIWDNGAYHQQTQGPGVATGCAVGGLTPGEERFEMERSWNLDFGGGVLNPPYDVRFYYEPAERTAIETAAANWMSTYPACGYAYKYPNPQGFYWFKNTGSNYTAPDYDGLHLGAAGGTTPNGINYGELNGIASFSGGSGAVILEPTILLPVQWLYFDGETNQKINYLRWATESEQNTDYFNLQRSKDGVTFQTIGTLPAQGYSTTVKHYTYDDVHPFKGENYYRLELMNKDGKPTYSGIIRLVIATDDLGYIFYPNPTNDIVYYQYEATEKEVLKIEVLDVLGKLIVSKEVITVVGLNNIPVDLTTYPSGSYMVRVHNERRGSVHTEKIIKNKF